MMKRTKIALATALVALPAILVVAPLAAQNEAQLPGQKDVSRVAAGTYKADAGHTLVGWRANHFGFNDYFGIFGDITGTLEIDPAKLSAAKVDVSIPVARVVTASAGLNGHLLRAGKDGGKPDFFGPDPAPARFVSTSVVATSATAAKITGDLTLNGVTRPVVLQAEFTGAGKHPYNGKATLGFEATAAIKRSDFGMTYAIPIVSDQVELTISAAFEK
ncbi:MULTISPECIES: YceI family protein [unclassified Sphingobium]|uniref:YceI family protein n=1 Tax=unclassified Sphingobium TaxID=2611147 RepID=UPI00222457F4|nr:MULTISPECIES: YceI family protein [unclassified Sphingobium]MCW2382867.1 polyisoprenoid-binding protein YceI [Sphingobium sp. B2D3B]MCW2396960.1 polyisoprenoid-binding protein YceI [Sphingobium sp. B2D3C]